MINRHNVEAMISEFSLSYPVVDGCCFVSVRREDRQLLRVDWTRPAQRCSGDTEPGTSLSRAGGNRREMPRAQKSSTAQLHKVCTRVQEQRTKTLLLAGSSRV